MTDREIQERIEKYITVGLDDQDEDLLWIKFLNQPEWFGYFDTLVNIYLITGKINGKKDL